MKTKLNTEQQKQVAIKLFPDVYSCLKVVHGMDLGGIYYNTLIKVLVNHFDLHPLDDDRCNYMQYVESICRNIHQNPTRYFNFSYKKPKR
jgi:hypothetical protein